MLWSAVLDMFNICGIVIFGYGMVVMDSCSIGRNLISGNGVCYWLWYGSSGVMMIMLIVI